MRKLHCCNCKKFKVITDFYKCKVYGRGYRYECKTCSIAKANKYNKQNRYKINLRLQPYMRHYFKYTYKKQHLEDVANYHKTNPWIKYLSAARSRCNNSNRPRYKRYGGRGIKCLLTTKDIKKLWFKWKAYKLKQPSLDRVDNDGNYTIKNCRFIEKYLNVPHTRNGKKIGQYKVKK